MIQVQVGKLAQSHGYMISSAVDLTKVKYDFVHNYFIFLMLLTGAVMVSMPRNLKNLQSTEKFKDLRNRFEEESKECEKNVELIPEYFKVFDSSKNIPKDLWNLLNQR